VVVAVFVDGPVDKELEETTELLVLVTDEELDEELETTELLVLVTDEELDEELETTELLVMLVTEEELDEELETIELLVVLVTEEELDEELETIELLVVLDRVEHDTVHADAVPTNMTSCQPPFDQKVSIEEEDPATVGEKVSEIVVLPAAGIVAPLAGNPVAVNALPTTTGLPEVETFWYAAP
jgi:hypothetical protein